jgi:predicted outer membrane repeat protein
VIGDPSSFYIATNISPNWLEIITSPCQILRPTRRKYEPCPNFSSLWSRAQTQRNQPTNLDPNWNDDTQDEQFNSNSATQFGGVIHMAPGLWKSTDRLSSRGIEFSLGHELNCVQHLTSDQAAATMELFQVRSYQQCLPLLLLNTG